MTREDIIERMALASVREITAKQYEWTEENIQAYCYSDPYGMRCFAKTKREAAVMYDALAGIAGLGLTLPAA